MLTFHKINKMFTCCFTFILDSDQVALFWKPCKQEKKHNEVIKASKVCQITTQLFMSCEFCAYVMQFLCNSPFFPLSFRYEDILTILKIKFFLFTFTYKVTLLEPRVNIFLSHLSSISIVVQKHSNISSVISRYENSREISYQPVIKITNLIGCPAAGTGCNCVLVSHQVLRPASAPCVLA